MIARIPCFYGSTHAAMLPSLGNPVPVTLVNYIPFYYMTVSHTDEPPVVTGKFVQIRNGDRLFLVFSPGAFTKYHANIVERFCLDKGLEGGYDREGKIFEIFDRAWTVAGGGKFEIRRNDKTIRLYDDSMAYGKFERMGLGDIMTAFPEFSDYRVEVN